jgi:hypothetical protein
MCLHDPATCHTLVPDVMVTAEIGMVERVKNGSPETWPRRPEL